MRSCQKKRSNLIIHGRINRAKQVAGLECEFDSVRIEFFAAHGFDAIFRSSAEDPDAKTEKQKDSASPHVPHSRATIGTLDRIAILL